MFHQRFKTIEERFLEKVDKTDSCWNWTAATVKSGYGWFWFSSEVGYLSSHIASWRIFHDEKPEEWVLHTCDNKRCVNPDHLYLGDRLQNCKDARDRGQYAKAASSPFRIARVHHTENRRRGACHHMRTLTDAQIKEIQERYTRGGITQTELATLYGVGQSSISLYVRS